MVKTLNGLGAMNAALGNMPEARAYFREALVIARLHADQSLGDHDPNVACALHNLEKVQQLSEGRSH